MQPDIAKLFNSEFNRNEQLELVATTLEHLRSTHPMKWAMLGHGERVPEFKAVVKSLVRVADESIDHQATVAYVTMAVLEELDVLASSRRPRRINKGDLEDASRFSHEHATPVEVVLRTVALPGNREVPILQILEALSCRVLVTNGERKKIDSKHAWTVPATLEWSKSVSFGVRTLLPSLLPLIRYHNVDPELVLSLVPLSPVHEDRLMRFRNLVCASTSEEILHCYASCRRSNRSSFELSDDIYEGTARLTRKASRKEDSRGK